MAKTIKSFIKANKRQTSLNNIITAMEFMFPNNNLMSSERRIAMWKSFGAKIDTSFRFQGFSVQTFYRAYEKWIEINKLSKGTSGIYEDVEYPSVNALEKYCLKNNLAIVTKNDFYYPENGKMKSLNNTTLEGNVLLVEQDA